MTSDINEHLKMSISDDEGSCDPPDTVLRRATILSLFFCLIPIGYYSYDGHKYFTSVFSTSLGQSSGFNLR